MTPTEQSIANQKLHETSYSPSTPQALGDSQKLISAQEAIDEIERELERVSTGPQTLLFFKNSTKGSSSHLKPNNCYIITMRMYNIAPTEISKRLALWKLRPAILTARFYLPKESAFTSESMRTVPRDFYLQSGFYRLAIHRDPARTTATLNAPTEPSNFALPRPSISIK
ncbi:hypothetical protein MMC29_002677 [Sticta canariensis]|nr:hypothetical protein [Sticta canariensis]